MKARVAVFGILRFPAKNIESVLPHLNKFVQATREHDGCITYDVAEDPFEKGLIRFSELWPNRESLEKHLKADHILPWKLKGSESIKLHYYVFIHSNGLFVNLEIDKTTS